MLFSVRSMRRMDRDGSETRDRVNALGRVRLRGNISAALPCARHRHTHSHITPLPVFPQCGVEGARCLLILLKLNHNFASKFQFSRESCCFWDFFFVCRKGPELKSCSPKFPCYIFYVFPLCLGFPFKSHGSLLKQPSCGVFTVDLNSNETQMGSGKIFPRKRARRECNKAWCACLI